jgi:TRAP transporter 4TM/12TM fusion protein
MGLGLILFYTDTMLDSINFAKNSTVDDTSEARYSDEWILGIRLNLIYYFAIILIVFLMTTYIMVNFDRLISEGRILGISNLDVMVGFVLTFVVIDATFRAYGFAISGFVIMCLIYAAAGPIFPSIFYHTGLSINQISRLNVMELRGVYGFIMGIGSTWVAIFLIFAGIAMSYDLLDWLSSLGEEISKITRTGIVQMTLLSSVVIGSITGSAAANAATTGSFTIPMMKNQDISPEYASAFESVASSGGQILPPVMGVAAFLMADILGVSYLRIVQAGFLPALIFYASVGISIHIVVHKYEWTVEKSGKSLNFYKFQEMLRYVIPIFTLLYTLIILRFTPLAAGFYTVIGFLINVFLYDIYFTEEYWIDYLRYWIRKLRSGLIHGASDLAPLVPVLASLGIVLDIIQRTGLTQRLSFQLINLAGGSILVLLVLAMITSIVFGMGMPTPAAYILVVILTAPALIGFDILPITAHMFVFYAAVISAITPPVAIAVAVTSRIADSNFLKSSINAVKVGLVLFILPFGFVYNESLIYWQYPLTIIIFISFILGVLAISIGVNRHNIIRSIPSYESILYILSGCLLIFGHSLLRFLGVGILVLLILNEISHTNN